MLLSSWPKFNSPVSAGGSLVKGGDVGQCLHKSLPNLTKGVNTGDVIAHLDNKLTPLHKS